MASSENMAKSKKGAFWAWLVFSVLWCLYVIFKHPHGDPNAATKFMAEMQGTPLPDWDAERYLAASLVALLPPILIAGAWKALNWFIKEQDKIRSEQEEDD